MFSFTLQARPTELNRSSTESASLSLAYSFKQYPVAPAPILHGVLGMHLINLLSFPINFSILSIVYPAAIETIKCSLVM